MPADATTILDAVQSALKGLYPDIPIHQSKKPATTGGGIWSGFQPGNATPCFVVTCDETEDVDKSPSFEHVSVGYRVLVEFAKNTNVSVTTAPAAHKPRVVEDPEVRDKREALRRALYRPTLPGAAKVFATRVQMRPTHELNPEDRKVFISAIQFTYSVMEPRAEP